ncbi:MAG TPA: hypothetical protein PLZ51_10345 [Aggregatilineales bacterium]|nr:hypothetical protein [Aggregatilineales bacterium]
MTIFFQLLPIIVIIAVYGFAVIALRRLDKQILTNEQWWTWTFFVIFMPIVGSVMVFIYFDDKPRYK